MAKVIQIAPDAVNTWSTLPGNTGELNIDMSMIEDTVFGFSYKSEFPDMGNWTVNANAIYKGYAGYAVNIKQSGTSTAMTNEACTLVSGKTYQITATTKRIIDPLVAVVVKDGAVDHTADVLSIDYLAGTVTFKTAYTVTGAVTVTGNYLPTSQICAMNKYTLNMQAAAIDQTDLCIAQSNGGLMQYAMGLKTVGLNLSGFYKSTSTFRAALLARSPVIIDINPDGLGNSYCRGIFVAKSDKESGKVGELEAENVEFTLYVPDNALMASPFSWVHGGSSTLNTGVRTLLAAFAAGAQVQVKYLEDGVTGKQGNAIPVDLSLSGGKGSLNEFSVKLQGSGGLTVV